MREILCLGALFLTVSCGAYEEDETVVYKKPKPNPLPADVAALVSDHCGACHGPGKGQKGLATPARLKAAALRIENDTMPPGGGLSPEIKAKLLGE